MRVDNTLDDVLVAATIGVMPTADEVAAVEVPPGEDPTAFAKKVLAWAAEIIGLRNKGENGPARRLAQSIADEYVAAFDGQPKPAKSGGRAADTKEADKATPAEIAARPKHRQNDPMATPSELAGRVVGRVGR